MLTNRPPPSKQASWENSSAEREEIGIYRVGAECNGRQDSQRPDCERPTPLHWDGETKELRVYPEALGWGKRDPEEFQEMM